MVNPTDLSGTEPPAVQLPPEPGAAVFDAPTVAGIAARVDGAAAEAAPHASVVRAVRDPLRPLPLSLAQQRIWLAEQLNPGTPLHNVPAVLRLRGALHVPALRRALREIFRRHETLRTAFAEHGGEAVQVVLLAAWPGLPVADLAALPPAAREAEALRRVHAEVLRPFDLGRAPLARMLLARLDAGEWILALVLHRAVSDAWSVRVLFREVEALYAAFSRGEASPLPEPEVQYADYALWQRERLTGEVLDARLAWWRERLEGAALVLALPTDRPRPAEPARGGAVASREIPAERAAELRALARREGATPLMLLLAAWQVLLSRWAGQDDVVVGIPVAGRTRRELAGTIGPFTDTLPVRADLSGNPRFAAHLARVREAVLEVHAHPDLPLERLVEAPRPERSPAYTPLFQATFSLEDAAGLLPALPGVEVEEVDPAPEVAGFDLELRAVERGGGGVGLVLRYRPELFDAATAERMLDGYALLLGALPAGIGLAVMDLPLLRDGDRRQLEEWGAGPVLADADDATVHGLFAAQAARTPGRTALAWRGESLTYAELDRRSARLARRLRELGVGPETRVGVSLERTPGLVVALLAVLRAGGAYVPLDPAYPRERLGWMLGDAQARLVLTTAALAGRLPDGAEAVYVDAAGDAPGAADGAAPESGVLPENLSHVIFTSGSTGRPRGVMIRHAAAAVLVRWLRGAFTDAERSAVLFSTSVSFDVSVAEVFGTLCWGGTLVLAENALELQAMAGQGIVYASMVPTAAAELLRSGGIPASVRTLALGGEPLPDDLARALYALGTVERVVDLYGPTEDTTYSTCAVVPREGPVTIGRPVADTRARVLDGELRPLPPGVAGELYLAGGKLARGYAGRPDLTAERFLPDPYGAPGDRMYRVMDRARWRPDGRLEYLGRVDFQVKVRGFRVEPGEIEAALRGHPAVADAVVVAREDAPGGRGLVAYLTAAPGIALPGAAELRAHLARGLPEHMLPAAFVALDSLPLTPSGKTDRRALPAPGGSAAAAYVAPRNAAEEALAAIWAEVLGTGRVGVHDGFSEMGGHSLLAMRLVSRARAALGVEIPLRDVFEAQTVAALAARIGAGNVDAGALPPLVPADRAGPLPLSFAQQRLWFLHRLDPAGVAYNVPAVLRLRGPLDARALRRALAALVERHESLRTVFPVADGEPAQAILPAGGFAPAVNDLAGLPAAAREAEALRRAGEVAGRPFDLEAGPLFRAALLRLDAGDHVLVLAMHHVVTDGWSMGVLFRDLDALYGAFSRGAPSPLEPPALQYADYAAWQRGWLAGETLEAQLAYWRGRLAGAPPLLELPTDRARPQSPRGVRGALPLVLPGALVGELRALARGEGATLFTVVLAGFHALLSRYAGQDDVLVGTPVAGRRWAELEPLVGFFVNTLAIRADLAAGPDARGFLAQLRERVLEAQTHQDVPFERLVDELGVERSLGHSPLFQAMLTLATAAERAEPRLPGLAVEELPTAAAETPFDVGVLLEERGDVLAGEMDFRAELFEASTIARMAEHFRALLEGIAAHPERRIAELPLLAPGERARLLEWSAGPAAPPPALPVHEAFAEQAARTPGAAAVLHAGGVLTYAELDARSAGLARVLRGRGVGPEAPVGVLLEHSADAVVALLAVLRAGGCWLTLDPASPADRVARLLHDSGAAVVVTRPRWAGLLAGSGASAVAVDAAPDAEDDAPLPRVHPEGAAYLVYTSGSTGRPKGVVVPHGAAAAHFAAAARAYGLTAADRGLVFASLSFDVALEQLLPPLLVGASVLLRDPDPWAPAELAARVEAHGVTVADLPAAYWAQLVQEPAAAETVKRRLRVVSVGGEAFPPDTARAWAGLPGGPARLLNGYGPTEAVVTATLHELPEPGAGGGDVRVPIGRPVEGHTAYVLDGGGEPLPVGVPGELYLGGALARGYLGQPGTTAERFVPDAFGAAGARMYRTGDRARWLASGALEFLGRIDQQVKVRGFRIEPGEVEAVLLGHPRVREAVVTVREDASGERRLVAYVVPAPAAGRGRPELWPSVGEYPVYDDLLYHAMVSDERRNAAYREALQGVVAGRTAVDVGTGSEVLLARMCVEAGATRVYAVEVQEDSFRRARERVRELGLEDRVTVLHGDAATLALPEAVDVCVSELIGSIGGSEGSAAILDHARRWLKPGGAMVPRRCETWIAAATLPDELHADPAFGELAAGYAERVMDAVGHRGDLRLCVKGFPADALLSDAGVFEELDFTRVIGPPRARTTELRIGRGGRLDGFLLWIRFHVGERLAVDSLEHEVSWLPVFFPVFYPGVEVAAGESLRLECSATISEDGLHPDYHLRGVLRRLDGREAAVAFDSLHRRPPAAPNALHRRLVSAEGVRTRPAAEARPLASELREHLRARLPEYMVPGALVLLEALPLSASGKVDRRALPAPERGGGAAYAPPRTPTEELVAGIFGEVLGAARIGARDNFFELGGHSLLATRVVARLRAALGVEMPLRALFEAQTVAALAARVEAERAGDAREAPPPLVRAERGGPAPLSFAQERLWFLHAMEPDEVGYNMAGPLRLRGRLDAAVLARALAALVERHEPLRTTFRPVARGAVQVVHPAAPARLPVADLGRLAADARAREAARLAQDDAARPFDLARGPVFRAALARLADDEHVLLLCMHHVVSDGWSMDVLFRDLFTLYGAFARGAPSPLPPLPVSYADFAAWQRGWLAGDALRRQLDWWRERLRGASPVLELPTDRPRPAVVSGRGDALPFAVPGETARLLHALARREGATLYMVARAAADLLLARWSGQEDIVAGSPIANRTRVELDGLVGMFVNTLALRTDLSGDPTFPELLARVRETALGAYAHQDLPFERLVEEIAPERSLSHTPLFQVMFALQNTQGAAPPSLEELRVEEFPLETRAALFDLELELWGADGGLAGGVRFRTDLFDGATIERFSAQYLAVLAAVCAAPDARLSAISVLPPEEARQLLAFGGGTAPAGSADSPVPLLLAEQAARTPDAAAVRCGDGSLTHAELDASANRLAHRLRSRGVGAGTTVAVCVERGPQVLVALLAVWKAGGVYLPLDPTHPRERLAFLLRDSGAELVVTEAAVAASLPEFGGEMVVVETPHPPAPSPTRGEGENDDDTPEGEGREALPQNRGRVASLSEPGGGPLADARPVSPGDLAYLVYTSGSTGEPKAVAVEHGQLAHTLRAAREVLGLGAADLVAALASVAFDISLLELVAPLLAGAAVRVVPRELVRDPEALVDAAADVTVLHAVPALMRQVVDAVRAGRELPSMRLLLVGGDSVPPELLRDLREVFPAAAARVLYGPTEGTIICATYGVPAEGPVAGHPLGRPLPGVRLAVRGPRGELCPVGVPGELWIAGGGVARGYLGRPELTAERFVTVDGERAYRTGDRARWRPDGVLEFLGRTDEQVKVRGFRIEPGEVEAALRAQPGVREAVVVAREDRPGERRLVAYVVPRPAAELPGDAGGAAEQVAGWEAVFDETYGEGAAATDPTLNLTGWNSSYTGEPIPREEMREWVEHTVRRILALRPERVLEIGCGTGLLLFRVAPRVRAYHGTDFSGVALDFVRRHLGGLPQVALSEREADRLEEYAGAGFDTVVLNSVAQYFPGVDYLLRVLEGAVAAVRPGGRIFVGDVRSLQLLGAFHASVELARAAHDLPAERLRGRVRRGIAEEQELLVDPALWEALRARIPRLRRVEVQVKRGGHDNEVSRFRYDVVLHLDAEPAGAPEPAVRDWGGEDAAGLRGLAEQTVSALLVRGVPDARVRAHVRALDRVAGADGAATAGAIHALAAADADPGVEPEAVFALAEALGRGVEARPGAPGTLDVLFHPADGIADFPAAAWEERPWEAYANDPRWGRRRRALVPALRQAVRARLPEYMLPSAFVVLESLPVTANGKVDRAALPAPDTAGAGEGRHVAPRTPAEERMAAVWAEVLGAERVGAEDNFFELGGHSLLATQVASRVREAFRVELPLRAVFEAPTVAELARRVERLRWDAAPAAESPPLAPVSREARSALPLSFAQQRLWFIDRLEPGSAAYNLPLPLRLRGALDARVLARTLGEVVRRHEALRTVFDGAGAEPVQVVRPAAPVPLPAADLSGLAEDAREAEARRVVAGDVRRPFDLRRGPLLYARLLRLAPEDHVLVIAMHHVVTDGWSMGVLFREMAALYGAFARGAPSPLPELPVQYADFAVWQRGWLTGEVLERQLAWWRERLAGAPAVLEIPTDRPRRPAPGSRAALVARTLPRGAADRVRALARGEGATLYMVLLAALDVLLARWSGGADVVVGTPIANRTRRETEGLIGFFVNTLALRADLSGDPTFRELLERLRESTLGAYQHQDLPFERLVEELGVERSLAHTPLFQVVFSVDDGGGTPRPLGPVRVEHYEAGDDAAKFDLAVAVTDTGAELEVAFTYRAELWEGSTLERVLDAYLLLLDAAAADPALRVAALPLVTEGERALLLREWSGGALVAPDDRGIHELFAEQARRTPDAVAVADRGSSLTYGALADRAGVLARRLRALGVGPDVRVGICAERGAPTVAAMLAVAAAGGAYVPLDPEYPAERLAFMLANAGVRVLLSDGAAGDRLADFAGEVVRLEAPSPPGPLSPASGRKGEHDDDTSGVEGREALPQNWERVASPGEPGGGALADASSAPADTPEPVGSPDSLACVLYTSGSTGRPKGVAVTHRGIVRLVRGADFVQLGPGDRVAQTSNPVFDVATWEVWGPLLNGGRVVCMDRDTALDARGLAATLRREGVTALFLTTALFNQAVREVPDAFAGVRDVLFGGEAADPAAVRACLAGGRPLRLLNVYGPTENTTFSSWQEVDDVAEDAATVPIGRAVAGSTVYVLDAEMEPVPTGWPGELYVGGHGLARGYLGRPDTTAATFVPDPFSRGAGARLYRTGDRARWLAGGNLEFLGRADQQAKIRGFRIEPGEVEAALLDHPEVREAAVLVREDAPGERRLAAYVVPRGDAPPGAEALRAHLRRTLPDYMVPAAVVALARLPLTATGKVDRRALPAPELAGGAGEHAGPRTPTEALLAAICAGVLGVERVGARDDFFALGGHSLLATRVVARVRDTFGVELPLRAIFEAPTVAGLAERVDALLGSGAARHAPPLARAPRDGSPLPLSFAQQRLWFVEQVDPGTAAYTLPVPLRLRGPLDAPALGRALDEVVRRHEALRTTFTAAEGEPVQVVGPARRGVLETVELSTLAPAAAVAEAGRLANAAMLRPFDLERGPLFRATLARIAPDDAALLLAMHHAVADGWSLGVLLRELSVLYGAFSRGEPSPLPELPFQYADFAAWQRGWLAGEVLERQVAWWRDQLAGAPPLLELPTDRPRTAVRDARGGARAFRLPAAVALSLRELSAREGATLFMTVLAGWQALLARWSGQDDVVVGSPIAGRTHLELEGLIGFFVNTLPLRTGLSGDPAFAALLRRVRESTLGAYAHQDVPFERLVEELGVERSLTHTPLFQAVLSLQNLGPLEHPLGDARTEPLETESLTVRFDLALALAEEDEEIGGGATFRADLWDGATVERMLDGLGRVLEQAAADPSRPLSSLELLGSAERARVLEAWNDTAAEVPPGLVHERVAAQAARTPDAPAVVFGNEVLTFAELMAQAGGLARRLRRSGVGPDARVGLFLERGPGLVAGVLGILRAGGAYLALDPSHPDERLLFMLRDAGAAAVVADPALAPRIAGFGGAVVGLALHPPTPSPTRRKGENDTWEPEGQEALPQNWGRVASLSEPGGGLPADASGISVHPDNLAYVVYTSGSTGTPKGVLVTHRGLANYLAFFDREVLGDDGFALPLVSRLSFDAHVRQLFPPLLRGEPVWVLPEDAAADPVALLEALGSRGRVSFGGVPSLWGAVMDALDAGERPAPRGLRAVLLGGEALPAELVRRTRERFPDVRIWNHYGPTEATVNTTVARVEEAERVSLGRPIANARVYLLDAHGTPVPTGVAGELHVGGAGVSRGYLGRPELTAEKFVPDPFAGEPGARLYRSGDRARWLATGELEYLGRTDQQVKVRGFRVEPGEIEAALRRHPAVRDAVVDAREDGRGGRRLVGYVVAAGDAAVSAGELRAHLAGELPEYMVPAAFVALDALPLTPNGKVDRRALPEPDASSDAGARAALTPTQEILAGIWGEYLAVEGVGPDSDFFALGGHSLTATGMISRVRAAFGVEVPLRAVFEGPRLARLAERIDVLLEDGAGAVLPPLARAPRTVPLPLSFAQQRLWFIEQMDPDARLYALAFAYRVRGALDVRALRRSTTEVARRHEVLRTRFEEVGGEPVQVVDPPAPVPLPVVDLRPLGPGAAERRAVRLAEAEVRHRFDLRAGPLLRTTLVRMADDDWALLLTVHHVVFDGWSTGVFNVEVSELYGAYAAGREPDLPELPFQYADYAVWQRDWLAGELLAAQLAWWRERLAGAPPLLELPTDFPRPPVPGAAATRVYFDVPEEATRRLYALARREGATLFMALLAAWQLLLARWSGQDDVVTGAPIAGRRRTEVEPMVGFFVNTLALRTDVGGDPTFGELLRRLREATLGAYQHQDVPFERLVEALGVRRSLSHAPVFQNLFAVQNHERLAMRLEGLRLEPFPTEADAARTDLALTLVEGGDRLLGMLTFRTELWEAATMQRLLGRFMRLLEEVGAAPERRVSGLRLLDDAERARLLAWSGAAPGEAPRRSVHELFAEQAARTPDAPAVAFGPDVLSYAELDRRSRALAAALRARGVGPESRVGLCAERSAAMVVAMLAVLRAGGAYVPLDPRYPAARLAYVLADAGVRVLLTDGTAADRLADFRGEVVALDTRLPPAPSPARGEKEHDDDTSEGEDRQHGDPPPQERGRVAALRPPGGGHSADASEVSIGPDALACVVYTSGSTGAPKGVAVPHRGVVRLVRGADFVRLGPGDRVAQLSNPAFDAATWEVWGALLNGGCVVGIDRDTSLDPRRLADALRGGGVTALFLTTALFNQAVREAPDAFAGVRHVLFGGEAADPAAVRACLAGGAPERLLHVYGPTENTTFSTWHVVEQVAEGAQTVPIGRAVAGSTAYVLDGALEPAPEGWPGELYLGGQGLARGYLDRPDATAGRFVPDPFAGEPGTRMYRTGDRARWSPAGAIEFIGRTDQQVKIRGFRIEPGEVEAALLEHPALADAVVAVREDAPGERRLVAYVVPREGSPVDAEALREGLRRKLPDYMVPGALVVLEALPLTATGKTDRAALPAPYPAGAAREFVAPRTPVEEMLAGIWAEVLGVVRVGAEDDFFDLGGHSLLATRVASRVRAACGVELPVRALFESPTLERLAERVEAGLRAEMEDWEMEEELERLEGLSDEDIARLLEGL